MKRDWRGTPIFPGDIVVYPVRSGSHIKMVEAEVIGFGTQMTYYDREEYMEVRRLSEHRRPSWSERGRPQAGTHKVYPKTVKLSRIDLVTVVTP